MKRSEFVSNFENGEMSLWDVLSVGWENGLRSTENIYDNDGYIDWVTDVAMDKLKYDGPESTRDFLDEVDFDAEFYDVYNKWNLDDSDIDGLYKDVLEEMDECEGWESEEEEEVDLQPITPSFEGLILLN